MRVALYRINDCLYCSGPMIVKAHCWHELVKGIEEALKLGCGAHFYHFLTKVISEIIHHKIMEIGHRIIEKPGMEL